MFQPSKPRRLISYVIDILAKTLYLDVKKPQSTVLNDLIRDLLRIVLEPEPKLQGAVLLDVLLLHLLLKVQPGGVVS